MIIGGVYVLWRGELCGQREEAAWKAEHEEYIRKLHKETEEDIQNTHDQFASMYRSVNTILSYAGLEPLGDGGDDESL